jgi:dTDP-4-dehydrorhamnose reductase
VTGGLLVTGGAGQLGCAVVTEARARSMPVLATSWQRPVEGVDAVAVDVRDAAAVDALIARSRPSAVIHTAYRYDDPDGIVAAASAVAHGCARYDAHLVHLSTDAVFGGATGRRYELDDVPDPVHAYGRAKRDAEATVLATTPTAAVVRTSLMIIGDGSGQHEQLALAVLDGQSDTSFFDDELRRPVWTHEIAGAVVNAAIDHIGGLHHAVGPELLSRADLARRLACRWGRDESLIRSGPTPADIPPRPRSLDLIPSAMAAHFTPIA